MVPDRDDELDQARRLLGMTVSDLWLGYFALGGMCTTIEIDAALHGAFLGTDHDRDLLAVALNEGFSAIGGGYLVAYSGDDEHRD